MTDMFNAPRETLMTTPEIQAFLEAGARHLTTNHETKEA